MLIRRIYFGILLFVLSKPTYSQLPELQWSAVMQPTSSWDYSNARSVAVDGQGNVYSVGLFMHTLDFDPGPGVFMMTAQGPYDYGIFVCKLGPNGQFIWAKQIPALVEFSDIELDVDNAGNVY